MRHSLTRRLALLFLMALAGQGLHAQRIAVTGALTADETWQAELSYHQMLNPYVGLGAGLGLWRERDAKAIPSGKGWRVHPDDERIRGFYLHPSIVLITPPILRLGPIGLGLTGEAGAKLSLPYDRVTVALNGGKQTKHVSTTKGQWASVDGRLAVFVNFSALSVSLGYQISNLDIYARRRKQQYGNVSFAKFYPSPEAQHAAFASLALTF